MRKSYPEIFVGIGHYGVAVVQPLKKAQWKMVPKIKCHLVRGQENSFDVQIIFVGLRPGGWAKYQWKESIFNQCCKFDIISATLIFNLLKFVHS